MANGHPHGVGELTDVSAGERYAGAFSNGLRHGTGTLTYEGPGDELACHHWSNNEAHGHCVLSLAGGGSEEGEWVNGVRHGMHVHRTTSRGLSACHDARGCGDGPEEGDDGEPTRVTRWRYGKRALLR